MEIRATNPVYGAPDALHADNFHITKITSSSEEYEKSMNKILNYLNEVCFDVLKNKSPKHIDQYCLQRHF